MSAATVLSASDLREPFALSIVFTKSWASLQGDVFYGGFSPR
jgi:hypothetical protein